MSLGVNNHVAFCGKNNGIHKALKKLEQEKVVSDETLDKLSNELVDIAKRSKAEQKEAVLKKSPSIIEKTTIEKIVDKLGVEVPKEMELAKRSKAEQMETMIRESALNTSFQEKIRKILGKV